MRFLLIPAISLALALPLAAQSTQPVDAKSMLDSLQQIQDKQAKISHGQLNQALADFSAAASNDTTALNFYMQAIFVTRFQGRPQAQSDFQAWKKKVSDENRLLPMAIRTCLLYMTISLQRIAGATDQQTVGLLLNYMETARSMIEFIGNNTAAPDDAADAQNSPGQRMRGRRNERQEGTRFDLEVVQNPIDSNLFAAWYNIGDELKAIQKWEMTPINLDGIADKFLLPTMRKTRDRRILDYWSAKITAATQAASKSDAAFSVDTYNSTHLPDLLWNRATDMIIIGFRDQGLTQMFQLVKQNPTHPNEGKWITELKGLLSDPASVPPPPAVSSGQ